MHQRAVRWLLFFTMFGLIWPASLASGLAQGEELYEDPDGRFTVPIPSGWTAEQADGYGVLTDPDGEITMTVLAVEAEDAEAGAAVAWELVEPGFAMAPLQVAPLPPPAGIDEAVVITYDIGQESSEIVQAMVQQVGDVSYVLLIRTGVIAAQERASQINIVASGFTITGVEGVSLAGVEPLPFEGDLVDELETYIVDTMDLLEVPGATIAIVQDGQVVYREAFGVSDLDTGEPLTPDARMMIGSTTKPVTTMMLATLVDEGVIEWDTPVVDILPSFAVADPEVTAQLTVKDLVCACTGVPRRDLELLFNADILDAEGTVASLASFEFFTPVGEAFQYSNQMVAAGGYIGAFAVYGETMDLQNAYIAAVTERVLAPIGMDQSTFSFAEVEASGAYAVPHGMNIDGEYVTLPISMEEFLVPIAPSGGLWSTVDDMSLFMMTLLERGVAPDGTKVVSAENLERTWEPQVPVDANISYGLGWFVETYKDLPLIHHGGNTLGFTSDFAFMPESGIGIVVLTNGQGTNLFNEAVRYRFLELVFEQEPEYHALLEAVLEGEVEPESIDTSVSVPGGTPEVALPGADAATPSSADVDAGVVEPYMGEYMNEALGTIVLELVDGRVYFDAGEFRSQLRAVPEDPLTFVAVDPPLAGMPVELMSGDGGELQVVVGAGTVEYTFVTATAGAASPVASPAAAD